MSSFANVSIFDILPESAEYDPDDYLTYCSVCIYEERGCCSYDEPLGRVCIQGSGFQMKSEGMK